MEGVNIFRLPTIFSTRYLLCYRNGWKRGFPKISCLKLPIETRDEPSILCADNGLDQKLRILQLLIYSIRAQCHQNLGCPRPVRNGQLHQSLIGAIPEEDCLRSR